VADKISRRAFFDQSSRAAVGAGILLGAGGALGKDGASSRVVEVRRPGAVGKGRKVDAKAVDAMVRKGMQKLTGAADPWKKLFKPGDRVGLKINTLGRPRIYTHHELVEAVAAQLQAAGIKPEHVIVWDRFKRHMTDCGFEMKTEGACTRCYASEDYRGEQTRLDDEVTYVSERDNAEAREDGRTDSKLSSIFTRECDKVINLAILKDHGLSGVTLCLKNIAFGLCDNNRRFHQRAYIGPFISEFCARKDVRAKFTLHLIDGLEGCYDGGPCPGGEETIFAHDTIWFGFDPVALDTVGAGAIEARRKQEGLPDLEKVGRHPRHIQMAAKLGVGIDDPKRIQVETVAG